MVFPWVAAAGLAGSVLNWWGNEDTNDSNRDIARENNAANMMLNQQNNAFSAAQAQKQMDFQERMSGTAYQRSRQDMLKAGLNPILAVTQGGASSPGGAQASPSLIPNQQGAPAINNMTGVVSSALDFMRTFADVSNALEQNKKIRADTRLSEAQAASVLNDPAVKQATALKLNSDIKVNQANISNIGSRTDISRADLPLHQLEGSTAGLAARGLGKVVGLASSAFSAAKGFKSLSATPHLFERAGGGSIFNRFTGELHR